MFLGVNLFPCRVCVFRMEWLQQGSRELFGTIIEDQVCTSLPEHDTCAPCGQTEETKQNFDKNGQPETIDLFKVQSLIV